MTMTVTGIDRVQASFTDALAKAQHALRWWDPEHWRELARQNRTVLEGLDAAWLCEERAVLLEADASFIELRGNDFWHCRTITLTDGSEATEDDVLPSLQCLTFFCRALYLPLDEWKARYGQTDSPSIVTA